MFYFILVSKIDWRKLKIIFKLSFTRFSLFIEKTPYQVQLRLPWCSQCNVKYKNWQLSMLLGLEVCAILSMRVQSQLAIKTSEFHLLKSIDEMSCILEFDLILDRASQREKLIQFFNFSTSNLFWFTHQMQLDSMFMYTAVLQKMQFLFQVSQNTINANGRVMRSKSNWLKKATKRGI